MNLRQTAETTVEARVVRISRPMITAGNAAIALTPDEDDEAEDWLVRANAMARGERQPLRLVDTEEE